VKDSTDKDLAVAAKVCDWAENIDIVTTSIQSRDWVSRGIDDVHQVITLLKNTTKHIHHINPVGDNIDTYWEIMKALYDGDEELARNRPVLSIMVCATSPLEIGHNDAQSIIKAAKHNIPLVCQTMALAGATGPAQLAGSTVVTNCEILSQLVLTQLVNPGNPVWYATTTTILDLYDNTAPMGNPEISMVCAAISKLAHHYGIPMWSAGMWTDSKVPDEQAASEKTLTSFVDALAGASMIYGCGNLELGSTFSPEQLIIDDSIIHTEKIILNGMEVTEETCSVELIKRIGSCGDFLVEPSTMEALSTQSRPKVFDRNLLNTWRNAGGKDAADLAHDIFMDIMKNYEVEPIPADKLAKMEKIVKDADEAYLEKLSKE
jgi:trimethylamine--corrinoid protein Co-methyltransferase